tara:strand:- start:110 stop:505 length:396 start_codon:yes stop_codon:yes gene_type:complete
MTMELNNQSYESYMKGELEGLSKHFSIKSYKLATQEEWLGFERGSDVRVQIQWKGDCIWEWILEKTFWVQRNTNKEDRIWMRNHADVKIDACKNAIIKKKPTETKTKMLLKEKSKVGSTQLLFDENKKVKQ